MVLTHQMYKYLILCYHRVSQGLKVYHPNFDQNLDFSFSFLATPKFSSQSEYFHSCRNIITTLGREERDLLAISVIFDANVEALALNLPPTSTIKTWLL